MRHLARPLFILWLAVSLALLVAVGALWALSYHGPVGVIVLGADVDHLLDSHKGRVTYVRQAHKHWGFDLPALSDRVAVFWGDRYHHDGMTREQEEWDSKAYHTHTKTGFGLPSPPYAIPDSLDGKDMFWVTYSAAPAAGFGAFSSWNHWGWFVSAGTTGDVPVVHYTLVSASHGWLAMLAGALPAVSLFRYGRSRRRKRAGQCPTCGYDLRASPERCPECGAAPAERGQESVALGS